MYTLASVFTRFSPALVTSTAAAGLPLWHPAPAIPGSSVPGSRAGPDPCAEAARCRAPDPRSAPGRNGRGRAAAPARGAAAPDTGEAALDLNPPVPAYTRSERAADTAVHALGLLFALVACALLALALPPEAGARPALALTLYAVGLLAMLGCSALYNIAGPVDGWVERRGLLRRLDHAAIFVMIAGTYTAVAGIGIGGAWGWGVAALVWTGAAGGAALKLLAPARVERASVVIYLLLGWAGIVILDRLLEALPALDLWLLLAGGLLYSLGTLLHLSVWLRYHNALWHACVLAATACHYVVVLHLAERAG